MNKDKENEETGLYEWQKPFAKYFDKEIIIIRKRGTPRTGILLRPKKRAYGSFSIAKGHCLHILTTNENVIRVPVDNVKMIIEKDKK